MKHIIHDWDDEDSVRILKSCHRALPEGGRILVVEAVVPPPGQAGWAKLLDLEMLVLTPRGRERTELEYAQLFAAGSFRLTRTVPTPSVKLPSVTRKSVPPMPRAMPLAPPPCGSSRSWYWPKMT